MNQSLFIQYVSKLFGPIARKVVEKVNGATGEPVYRFKTMLRPEYSTTLKWGSLSSNNVMVAADVVSMNSSLPLKKRDSLRKAEGDIPKIGTKRALTEQQLSELNILKNQSGQDNIIATKLFADTKKVIHGVYETLEFMFLQALSTGVTSITTDETAGTGVRIDFGHPDENKFGAEVAWSQTGAKPLDDIDRVLAAASAKGDSPRYMMMDRATFNAFRNNAQVKELYAFSVGFSGSSVPTPNLQQLNDALSADRNLMIEIIDRTITFEKNGVRTAAKPWADHAVVFVNDTMVGTLTYGQLAEEVHRAAQVSYEKVDNYILVSKYHKIDPLQEFTSSQALALPVIDNVDSIYILNSEEAEAITGQTEADATITIYNDSTVTRANLITALNDSEIKSSPVANSSMTDVELIKLVNKLSNKKEAILKAILEIPIVDAGSNTTADSATKALVGTATAAGDKTIATVAWSQVSGPNTAGFSAANALSTNVTGLVTGTYVFRLTVTDSEGIVASDTVEVVATVA